LPAQSPHFNITEPLWSVFYQHIKGTQLGIYGGNSHFLSQKLKVHENTDKSLKPNLLNDLVKKGTAIPVTSSEGP
jgi:hypothetical protein